MRSLSPGRTRLRLGPIVLLIIALVLLFPLRSEAYAGPGAGFAVLSSFWTIFVAFLYSFYALVTWPIRQLLRSFRRRKAYGKAQVKRVVIIGFDGMDPELANRFIGEGRLPNLAKLRDRELFVRCARHFLQSLRWHGQHFRLESIRASTTSMIFWRAIWRTIFLIFLRRRSVSPSVT